MDAHGTVIIFTIFQSVDPLSTARGYVSLYDAMGGWSVLRCVKVQLVCVVRHGAVYCIICEMCVSLLLYRGCFDFDLVLV